MDKKVTKEYTDYDKGCGFLETGLQTLLFQNSKTAFKCSKTTAKILM
jgi:hypothetical protein